MTKNNLTCLIIGTGFSGLAMAIKLKERGIHDFVILEKAADVGGTWRENTYPGAECDIPSALYSYSFEPYPFWEYKWSLQPQILDYIKHVTKKYDLTQHIHFQQEMVAANWNANKSIWIVKTKDKNLYQTKILITAIGQLHHPTIPNFSGRELLEKDSWHSAQWNHNISLEGKTVGVIGNAASAIQFIPEISKVAQKVIVFQRTANWIIPKQDRAYKSWEKKLVGQLPFLLKIYRSWLWAKAGLLFLILQNENGRLRKIFEYYGKWYLKKNIKDPKLVKQLIPTFPLGAKRVLFSDTYYQALARPNVNVVLDKIQNITKNGIQTQNAFHHEVDVLIYATGFKTNPFLLGLKIHGKNGISIQKEWENSPKNYLGITVNNFPNLFMMYGPNTNLGHNSIILMSEAQADYIAQCVEGLEKNNWKSMEVKKEVLNSYYNSIQKRLKKLVWSSIQNSWYQSANGNIPNNFPGRTMEYMRITKKVDFEDFELEK